MPKDSLLFQAISLLSQHLADLEPIMHRTSCLDQETREMIGFIEATKLRLDPNDPKQNERIKRLDRMEKMFEIIGMAKWPRTELTDLGLRIGQRHKEKVQGGYEFNEVDIMSEEGAKKE